MNKLRLYILLITLWGLVSNGFAQNTGINTPLPTNTLDINGTLRIRGGAPGANKIFTSDANGVGSWANPPSAFSIPYVGTASVGGSGYILDIANTTGSDGSAIIGRNSTVVSGEGVAGIATATAPLSNVSGVFGRSNSTNANGAGVRAFHSGTGPAFLGNTTDGIGASLNSTNGFALKTQGKLQFAGSGVGTLSPEMFLKSVDASGNAQWSNFLSGTSNDKIFEVTNTSAIGVGILSKSNLNIALKSTTVSGQAIFAEATGDGTAANFVSVSEPTVRIQLTGTTPLSPKNALEVFNNATNNTGAAIRGNHSSNGIGGIGVYGDGGTGVKGEGAYGVHGIGTQRGVFGEKTGTTGSAVHGVGGLHGVYGQSEGYGVYGVSNYLDPNQYKYAGVYGESNATNEYGSGVNGTHWGNGPGVNGYSPTGVGGRFNSDGGGYALITQTGNVGIGTATPAAKMDIKGSTYLSHFYYDTNEDTYIRGGKAGSRVLINDATGQGSVGIGIANPNQYVDVKGRMRIYNSTFGTAGIWMNNAVNGLGNGDGAFIGINCSAAASETVGFFVGGQWRFDVDRAGNGRFGGTVTTTAGFTCASDFRFKKDIKPLENALSNIEKINGVSYSWRKEEYPDRNFTDKSQIGFIAQDLEKVYPEMVFTDAQGYKSVDYARLTPVLIEAIKELKKENEALEKRMILIENLQSQINELKVLANNKN